MINRVVLIGRLTADPELKTTPAGVSVCSFSIAVDRGYVKQGEERKTDFINIVTWRGTAEFVSRYFSKGKLIAVDGSIQTRNYEDKQGNKRTAFEVVADNVSFCDSKPAGGAGQAAFTSGGENPFNPPAASFATGDNGDFRQTDGDGDLPF